jgi:hypothetical protein
VISRRNIRAEWRKCDKSMAEQRKSRPGILRAGAVLA